jgi:hypothetical protein
VVCRWYEHRQYRSATIRRPIGWRGEGIMPLSEHEQRVLEQIERALYADDPKFAATVRGIDPRTLRRRRYRRAAVGGCVGVLVIAAGFLTELWISAVGLALCVVALGYAALAWRREAGEQRRRAAPVAAAGGRRAVDRPGVRMPRRSFMQWIDDRWSERREKQLGN